MSRGAACVLLVHNDSVLAVSRGEDLDDWGLPGGRVERTDRGNLARTAARELREETGVRIATHELTPLYSRPARTNECTTFVPKRGARIEMPERLASHPFEGYVAWVHPSVLVAPTATFRVYARGLLKRVGLL